MFSVYCEHYQHEVLRGPRSILGLQSDANEVLLTYRCLCGAVGAVRTGGEARDWEPLGHVGVEGVPAHAA